VVKGENNRPYYTYDYWSVPIIHEIGRFSYYKILDWAPGHKAIQIGTDYGGEGRRAYEETIDSVSFDCKQSIDLLYYECQKARLKLKIMCNGSGDYVEEKDGRYTDNNKSTFYSQKYIETLTEEQRKNWFKDEVDKL
jgi:hypothetical protein